MARKRKIKDSATATSEPKQPRKTARSGEAPKAQTEQRITRSMKTDGPRKAVFSTTELLENILMCLPPKRILVSQRVSKQFQELIQSSIMIQQRLWMKPMYEKTTWYIKPVKPLNVLPLLWLQGQSSKNHADKLPEGECIALVPVKINEMLLEPKDPRENSAERALENCAEFLTMKIKLFAANNMSWTKMYLTDPPVTSISFSLGHEYYGVTNIQHSLTIGAVVDEVLSMKTRVFWLANGKDMVAGDAVIRDLMANVEQTTGTKRKIQFARRVVFRGTVVPSDSEWAMMEER